MLFRSHFIIKLENIACVAKHEYILDGAFRIVEMTVGSNGSVVARFIYAEPVGINEAKEVSNLADDVLENAEEVRERLKEHSGVDQDLWLKAIKTTVPPTTHYHTVDYRVKNENTINRLFKSASDAWLLGKGCKTSILNK